MCQNSRGLKETFLNTGHPFKIKANAKLCLGRCFNDSSRLLLACLAYCIMGMLVMYSKSQKKSLNLLEYPLNRTIFPHTYTNKQEQNMFGDVIRIKDEPLSTFKGRNILQIFFINKPKWFKLSKGNEYIINRCHFKNCVMTDIVRNISRMSAIVFSAQDRLKYDSSYLKRKRSHSQVWVFFRVEPPPIRSDPWYRDPAWTNTMNWSWGYRLDSDIFTPYGILTTKSVLPFRDYDTIFKRKNKLAAWVVSNCHTKSLRDKYVQALIQEGVQVDIFGKCSKNKTKISKKYILKLINDDYKFYLSFENNFCIDYVTEKFFTYLGLDTILVVRGGINYSERFNQKAFIDTSSFPTVKSLAGYILRISQNKSLYTGYLRNKDKYNIVGSFEYSLSKAACDLCEKVNNQERYRKNSENIATYIHNGTCFNPDKIL